MLIDGKHVFMQPEYIAANIVAPANEGQIQSDIQPQEHEAEPAAEQQPVLSPQEQRKARLGEIAKRIPTKGKTKLWTQAKAEDVAEYIMTLTDDVAKQQATVQQYIDNIKEEQAKLGGIEALELDEDIAFWESVKGFLTPETQTEEGATAQAPEVTPITTAENEAQPIAEVAEQPLAEVQSEPVDSGDNLQTNEEQVTSVPESQIETEKGNEKHFEEKSEMGANLANEASKTEEFALSELTDNDGNRFYQRNGSIDLWDLSPLFEQARRQNAPIRLTERNVNHILDEHKKELGDSEESVIEFLNNVFSNATILRKARAGGIFVVVNNTKTDKAAIIRLYPSKQGDYYNVESAGYYRKNKWKETENVIAELSEPTQSVTASDVSKPQVPDEGGRELLNAETATTSTAEDTAPVSNVQENSVKSDENTQEISENRSQISENTQEISENRSQISENRSQISENTQDEGEKDVIEEIREQNRVAEERQQRAGVPPRPSDYAKAITDGDAEAQKAWEGKFDEYLAKLTSDDLPTVESTIRGMQGYKSGIKAGNPKGYKENPSYKVFDYIEKALKKRKKELENSSITGDKSQEIEDYSTNNGEQTEPTISQESEQVSDQTALIKGAKWEKTGEPEKMKYRSKKSADSHDVTWYIGKKRYGSTTAERDLLRVLADEYGNLNAVWNAYEQNQIILSSNEAAILKKLIETNTTRAELQQGSLTLDRDNPAFKTATEETMNALAKTGVEVVIATQEQVNEVLGIADAEQQMIENANERFNRELDAFKEKQHKGLLHLGRPMGILSAAGVNARELTVSPTVLHQHLKKHNLTTDDLKGLAEAVQTPILVYRHGETKPHVVIVTELDVDGGKLSIALRLDENGNVVEVSNVSSVHSKNAQTELERLALLDSDKLRDYLRWVEKEKVSDWLGLPYEEERQDANPKLVSVANVINDFENPKVSPEFHRVYHGSGAKFDRFDHSFMGTGEGSQVFGWGTYVTEVEGIGKQYANEAAKGGGRNLYTVEIPDDNGSNYLHWEKPVSDNAKGMLYAQIRKEGVGKFDFADQKFWAGKSVAFENGELLYDRLTYALGSDKAASEFLSRAGFVGISYPAEATTGGRADGARNYAIFNENDAQITDRVEFLRTTDGTVYGWTVGGRIYLTPEGVNPNTPVHEYTHLWASAIEQRNPELWERVVDAMKLSPMWAEVMADEAYRDIWNDDNRMASEVLSRLSGEENYRRAMERAEADIKSDRNPLTVAEKVSAWERVKRALSDFWNKVKEMLGQPVTGEPKGDAPAWMEFVNGAIGDFYKGVNPNVENAGFEFAKRESERRREKNRINNAIDTAIGLVVPGGKRQAARMRMEKEAERKLLAKEIYSSVLKGDFNTLTLERINKYIEDATPANPFGRRISQRLPQRMERALLEGARTNAVDALFGRISESAVAPNGRLSEAGRRAIEEKKKEILKGWAIATGNWHTDLREFTDDTEPIGQGKDSKVYASKDGHFVIKVSKGKPYGKRFRPDIDNIPLFNDVFRNSRYEILGYGEIDGEFVRILKQPVVDFAQSTPLTSEERKDYMQSLGFEPLNDTNTAFADGEIVIADLQKGNVVRDNAGNITVIDADAKLHTKDVGGNYTYPAVETDLPQAPELMFIGEKGATALDKAEEAAHFDGKQLTEEQQAVVDVFGGKADNLIISVKTKDGNERKVVMRQGNEMNAGTKHSLFRHYGMNNGAVTADDILFIPEIIENGERTVNGKKVVYESKINGVIYKVVTEKVGNKEIFNNFYTNKKTSDTRSLNTLAGVQNRDIDTFSSARMLNTDASTYKGSNNSSTVQEDDTLFRDWYGGNSGYEGYSKSKRAVEAEERGLRSASQMNGEFAKQVNGIIEERTGEPSKLTLKDIKKVLPDIKADEWHHTSKFGNKTNYYSAENVASYFAKDPETELQERKEREIAEREDAYRRAVREKIPTRKVETELGEKDAFITSDGYAVEVPGNVLYMPEDARLFAIGELKDEGDYVVDAYSDWALENSVAFNKAIQEYVAAVEIAKNEVDAEIANDYRSDDAIKNKIEALFNQAISGEFKGKPISIGKLTDAGRAYLEQISGVAFKDKVDFVLNPSDLIHIYKGHFGNNETDERSIPLDIEDIRSIADVVSFPDRIIYAKENAGEKRKMFFFLKEADNGAYNLLEIYADKKGNLTAKTFYKTKEGVSQRAITLSKSLHTTSETDGATLNDGAKIPQMFETTSVEDNYSREGEGSYTDDELALESDPVSKALGKPRGTRKQRREFAQRERQRMAERVERLAKKLHLDNVEVVTDASTLEGKKQRAKGFANSAPSAAFGNSRTSSDLRSLARGFYTKSTGKITIVIPNHSSAFDVEQTLLHEAVAHYGLRQLFGKHFDTFLDNVFDNADVEVRKRIVKLAMEKYNLDFRKATEEYLASLAENTEFENYNASWWQKIKKLFLDMLAKVGVKLDFALSDNELRYILWRSYKNLTAPVSSRSVIDVAEDIAKQYELSVGNYATPQGAVANVAEDDIDAINERFNAELQQQINGTLPKGHIYKLGMPSKVLQSAGLPNLPIELAASRLSDKSMQENHPFELSEIEGLVDGVQNPLAVFRSATHVGSFVVLTEIQHKGKNYVVAIETNRKQGRIEINSVRSIHYRNSNTHITTVH